MRNLFILSLFVLIASTSSGQALTYVKSLCDNKARSWMDNLGITYRGDLTVSDVEEIGSGRLKVTGRFSYHSSNCGNRTCAFEAELKQILDEFEITSMCRNAPFCAMGVEYNSEWRCYPR